MAEGITKRIDLDLSGYSPDVQESIRRDVGEFVVNEILRYTADGISPVSGEGEFRQLNTKYAEDEKNGNTSPNLRLDGDMMQALDYKSSGGELLIGIWDTEQAKKADGHGHHGVFGQSSLPKRRFIPGESQEFDSSIMAGINDIISSYEKESPETEAAFSLAGTLGILGALARPAVQAKPPTMNDIIKGFFSGEF